MLPLRLTMVLMLLHLSGSLLEGSRKCTLEHEAARFLYYGSGSP